MRTIFSLFCCGFSLLQIICKSVLFRCMKIVISSVFILYCCKKCQIEWNRMRVFFFPQNWDLSWKGMSLAPATANGPGKKIHQYIHQILIKIHILSEGRKFILLWSSLWFHTDCHTGKLDTSAGLQARRRGRLCRAHCLNPSAQPRTLLFHQLLTCNLK